MDLSLAHSVGSAVEPVHARSDLFGKRRALTENGWPAQPEQRQIHRKYYINSAVS